MRRKRDRIIIEIRPADLAVIDAARGTVPRATFIRDLALRALAKASS